MSDIIVNELKSFYRGKRVFVTGHTGFKGSWLCNMLIDLGAEVYGYALEPPTNPSLYELSGVERKIKSVIGDIRDYDYLKKAFDEASPEIVFHLAAQPLVLASYENPKYTYETNVIGTVNLCECIRKSDSVKSFLNVTTDKVYENDDLGVSFTEDMPLDGYDPYSNSKSCSELVTHCYKKSFFDKTDIAVSTARAGNVIGGGDFADNRIVPDCIRAALKGEEIEVRNPYSIRPFQHVIEPLYVYLLIAMKQFNDKKYQGYYNVGPEESDCLKTGELVDLFCSFYEGASWRDVSKPDTPHEAAFLKLNTDKLKRTFAWQPVWDIDKAIEQTVNWVFDYKNGKDISSTVLSQINDFWESIT